MPRVVKIPVSRQHATLAQHARVQLRAGIRRLDMKCRGRNAVIDGPVHRAPEHIFSVIIHAEDKAAVDHDAERMQPVGNRLVVAAQVLPLVASSSGSPA